MFWGIPDIPYKSRSPTVPRCQLSSIGCCVLYSLPLGDSAEFLSSGCLLLAVVVYCITVCGFSQIDAVMNSFGLQIIQPSADISVDLESPKKTVTVSSKVAPDGGFGWAVVFASFVISFIISGFMKSFSAFRASIFAEFPGTSPSEAAWISGLIGTLSLVTSPVTGMLMTAYGFRIMVFAGGVLCSCGLAISYFATSAGFLVGSLGTFMGIGASFAFTSSVVCVGRYFTTKKPLAMALALSGGCVGAMALPTGIRLILLALGLRYTFLVMAGMFAIICVCSIAFGQPEDHFLSVAKEVPADEIPCEAVVVKEVDADPRVFVRFLKAASEKLALRFLADPIFVLTTASVFAMGMGNPHFLHYIPQQAEVLGATHSAAMALLAYAAIGDLVARLSYGMLASRSPFPRSVEYAAALVISATSVILLPFCSTYGHLIGAAVIAGLGTGVWTILIPLLLGSNHGAKNLNGTFALVRLFQGMANLIYPPVAGTLRSGFGTEAVLLFMGGMMCTAAVLGILLNVVAYIRNRQKQVVADC